MPIEFIMLAIYLVGVVAPPALAVILFYNGMKTTNTLAANIYTLVSLTILVMTIPIVVLLPDFLRTIFN